MPTIKLVVIGASGVGKTSLRSQYISGQFTTGYRATIGADFITKSLPHPSKPGESVVLQIWDTAGQDRFSSLSSAFFRGADAALLTFDVNTPSTLPALRKWWNEFRENAPVKEGEEGEFCAVFVGNKLDLAGTGGLVTQEDAESFMRELIPLPPESGSDTATQLSLSLPDPEPEFSVDRSPIESPTTPRPPASSSIAIIQPSSHNGSSASASSYQQRLSKSNLSLSSAGGGGTMTTTHTSLTIYHTPSSSLFFPSGYGSASESDVFESARSSFSSFSSSISARTRGMERRTSTSSSGSRSSGSTITPSLFARSPSPPSSTSRSASAYASLSSLSFPTAPAPSVPPLITSLTPSPLTPSLTHSEAPSTPSPFPPPPPQGPKLFFTSAKTGEGVRDVFEYVAARVVRRWEYEERAVYGRERGRGWDSSQGTISLGRTGSGAGRCC